MILFKTGLLEKHIFLDFYGPQFPHALDEVPLNEMISDFSNLDLL